MALEAFQQHQHPQEGINAAFMCNHRGEVCIAFNDPVYARADAVLVDKEKRGIHVILHGNAHLVSYVSEAMLKSFENNGEVLLTAIRPDGTLLELTAPIQSGQTKN